MQTNSSGHPRRGRSLAPALVFAMLLLPCAAAAQAKPDLVVEGLSVYAPMPAGPGGRRLTVSWRVVNRGALAASPSIARLATSAGPPPSAAGPRRGADAAAPRAGVVEGARPPSGAAVPAFPEIIALPDENDRATPALGSGETAYFARTFATTATELNISVRADVSSAIDENSEANNLASYHFSTSGGATGRWRPAGPSLMLRTSGETVGVGRVTTIAIDPRSANTIFVGARDSGVWKTRDGGTNWEPLTDAMPTTNVAAIAIDPTNPEQIYFVGQMGVFGSSDGGHAWRRLFSGDLRAIGSDGGALIVHSGDPSRLYLTTTSGLRVSQDGGRTWNLTPLGVGAAVNSMTQGRASPDHFFATVTSSNDGAPTSAFGVFETVDGGLTPQSWTKLSGCEGGRLPAIGPKASLWFAQSGVTQWVAIKDDSQGDRHEIWRTSSRACSPGIAPAIGAVVRRVLPDVDIGRGRLERVWERISLSTKDEPANCIGAPQNSRWSYLYADPTNPQIVYKAGIDLCRSTDGGRNFTVVAGPHVDHHAMKFLPAAPESVFIGSDGGFYRSEDRGATFQFRSVGLQIAEMLDLDIGGAAPLSVIAGTQDNGYATTDLSGPNWIHRGGGDVSIVVIDPIHPDTQYNVAQAVHQLARTGAQSGAFSNAGLPQDCIAYSENGQVFNQFIATTSNEWRFLATMDGPADKPACDGAVWTGSPWRSLFKTTDGEAFVRIVHDPLNGLFLAGGKNGSIYVNFSPDVMAKVWQGAGAVTSIVRNMAREGSYFVSLNRPAVTGRVFEIHSVAPLRFKGTDITANLPPGLVMTLASNRYETDALYAGTSGGGVWRAKMAPNGTWSWSEFNNGMPAGAVVTKLRVDQRYGLIHASTYGRGAFLLDTVSVF